MFKGYLEVDAVEVINVARTMAYCAAGYGQPDTDFDTPVGCGTLAAALGASYRTPALDAAPWYDPARPETWGFAGVLPLDITGMDGTTRAAAVVESIGDGGVAQKARRMTRTIAVSALLVGDSATSVDAGLQWLTTVLHRGCAAPGTALLTGYTVLPELVGGLEDLTTPITAAPVAASDGWRGYGGTWATGPASFTVSSRTGPVDPTGTLDGGIPSTVDSDLVDGGAAADPGAGEVDGGDPGTSGDGATDGGTPAPGSVFTGTADGGGVAGDGLDGTVADGGTIGSSTAPLTAHVVAPGGLGCLSRVEVTWTVTPLGASPVRVQAGATDTHGGELGRDRTVRTITAPTTFTWVVEQAPWEEWQPALWVSGEGVTVALTVAHRSLLDQAGCLAALRRTYAGLTCVAGPTIAGEQVADEDTDTRLVQVEWTWVAGDPYRYGDPTTLLAGLDVTASTAAAATAAGVSYAARSTATATSLACPEPVAAPSCGYDPSYPGFVTPPAAPVVSDPGAVTPASYHRRLVTLEPSVTPDEGTLALRWTLANPGGTAQRGIRVRLWRQADPDFATHAECGFETEFWVNYIDAGATLVIDGIAGTVTAVCDDGTLAPAIGVMRGPYRGAFDYPTLTCDGTYFVAVDTPSTATGLRLTLDAAPREG